MVYASMRIPLSLGAAPASFKTRRMAVSSVSIPAGNSRPILPMRKHGSAAGHFLICKSGIARLYSRNLRNASLSPLSYASMSLSHDAFAASSICLRRESASNHSIVLRIPCAKGTLAQ